MPAGGGDVTRVTLPETEATYCGEAGWSADGAAVLFLAGPGEGADAGPQLWSADAATGATTPLLPGTYARAPIGLPGGAVRFFIAEVERDAAGVIIGASFAPAELAPGASAPTALGASFPELIERALWAPDGSGAALEVSGPEIKSALRWQPAGGAALELPSSESGVGGLAWGVE
jgi:hypothetical protein